MSRSSWGFPKRQIEIDQETNSHSYLLLGNFPCARMKNISIHTPSGASIIWSKTKNHLGIYTYRFKKYNWIYILCEDYILILCIRTWFSFSESVEHYF